MATTIHQPSALSHSFAPGNGSFQSAVSNLPEEEGYSDEDSNPLGIGSSNGVRALGSGVSLSIADLLAGAVRFVEGTRGLEEEEIPYKAINVRSVVPTALPSPVATISSTPLKSALTKTSSLESSSTSPSTSISTLPKPLFPLISPAVSWPKPLRIGSGLNNQGNTCFLNSALQVLLHTAPLVRFIASGGHDGKNCAWKVKKGFCMTCAMDPLIVHSFTRAQTSAYSPSIIIKNIKKIAPNLRLGRQEDAHEFLRFCIDNMQVGALFGKSPKLDIKIKNSTFVHQIFGGRLRSRVTCRVCSENSDTFDHILDLSLDVQRVSSIKGALENFVKKDELKGANKYKCEKCKKLVVAEKSFTIEEAPMILTIHLKRFTPSGRKITDAINYSETLQLGPYMSDRSMSPTYKLYGVINHSGGGPHSGHYTAHVKSANGGRWHHMNDEFVQAENKAPLNSRNAYVLFYCREQGDLLNEAIRGGTSVSKTMTNGNGGSGKKRSRDSEDGNENNGEGNRYKAEANGMGAPVAKKSFIGPSNPFVPGGGPRPPTILATTSPRSVYQNPYDNKSTKSPYPNQQSPQSNYAKSNNRQGGGGGGGNGKYNIANSMKGRANGNQPRKIGMYA